MRRYGLFFFDILFAISATIALFASPSRGVVTFLRQPDGSVIQARLYGDEFEKHYRSVDGRELVRGEDGWYREADAPTFRDAMTRKRVEFVENSPNLIRRLRNSATKADNGIRRKHGLVIPVQFKDQKFRETSTKEAFEALLSQKGYAENGACGSAKDYFDAQFNGSIEFEFTVTDIVTLGKELAYYGRNRADGQDDCPEEMVKEACEQVDSQVDFSLFDDDGDGVVDNVFIFYAGGDEAQGVGENAIWSHAYYIWSGSKHIDLRLDNVRIDRYACTSELNAYAIDSNNQFLFEFANIGTFCHEYSHTFGLPDFYDTDYEGSGSYMSAGMWLKTSLMDGGNSNNGGKVPPFYNAVERHILGIGTAHELTLGSHSLEPVNINGDYYFYNSPKEGEYYLFECRDNSQWDEYIGGRGMLIYHIDRSDNEAGVSEVYGGSLTAADRWNKYNEVNANPDHQCADLVEADGRSDRISPDDRGWNSYISGIFFGGGNNSFAFNTVPSFSFWDGSLSSLMLMNIIMTSSGVTFNVIENTEKLPPAAVMLRSDVYQDGAAIAWQADEESDARARFRWGLSGGSMQEVEPVFKDGCWSVEITGLEQNKAYTAEYYFSKDGLNGSVASFKFTTSKFQTSLFPYIYTKNAELNEDGSFVKDSLLPLKVLNAENVDAVDWSFDGATVTGPYLRPAKSGKLKATVHFKDGSKAYAEKMINVK